jgi:hypothetical protein
MGFGFCSLNFSTDVCTESKMLLDALGFSALLSALIVPVKTSIFLFMPRESRITATYYQVFYESTEDLKPQNTTHVLQTVKIAILSLRYILHPKANFQLLKFKTSYV